MKKSSGKRPVVSKARGSQGKVTKIIHESTKEIKLEKALIDNFIALQKVMVNLSSRFDNLSSQIAKLLELFEISAKSLARKDFEDMEKENKDVKKVLEKLDNLTQQAGLIGKGLALIHEVNNEKPILSIPHQRPVQGISSQQSQMPRQIPLQQLQRPQQNQQTQQRSQIPLQQKASLDDALSNFKKSIATKNPQDNK